MDWFEHTPDTEPKDATFGVATPEEARAARPFFFGEAPATQTDVEPSGADEAPSEEDAEAAQSITQEELDRAYEEGFEAARVQFEDPLIEKIEAQQERHRAALERMLQTIYDHRTHQWQRLRPVVVELAGILAEQILGQALEQAPWLTTELAGQLIERAVEQEHLRLHVRPEAAKPLQENVDALIRRHPDNAHVEVIADDDLDLGDCRLVVDGGAIEGRLRERVEHLVHAAQEAAVQHPWFDEGAQDLFDQNFDATTLEDASAADEAARDLDAAPSPLASEQE